MEIEQVTAQPPAAQPSPQQIRVLMIEDDDWDAEQIKEVLCDDASAAFHVTHSSRLKNALALANKEKFDLILTDLTLPDSQSRKTFQKIFEKYSNLPIIVISGAASMSFDLFIQEHAFAFFLKGIIDPERLIQKIHSAVTAESTSSSVRVPTMRPNGAL